jgi:hypothetical protein
MTTEQTQDEPALDLVDRAVMASFAQTSANVTDVGPAARIGLAV